MAGKLTGVLFRPEDMRLIEGSPARRRQYLDQTLAVAHPEYGHALNVYEASLKRRNRLLDSIREGEAKVEQLAYWDQSVIKNGNILTDYRRDYLTYLSQLQTSFGEYEMSYNASTISPARLAQHSAAEIALGYTLVGPHKDDFIVRSQGRDLMKYGSRGEQRLAVLFLKLGNMQYIEKKLGVKPILLLDDIFSELDQEHREEVLKMTKGRQTIITTAEEDVVKMIKEAEVISI
jgi:DNA replication and repair protein RecF